MSGFLSIHQFLSSAQFRKLDPSKVHPPTEWKVVEAVLKHVPAASRDTLNRLFYAKDYLTDSCLSTSSTLQRYTKVGLSRLDGKDTCNFTW